MENSVKIPQKIFQIAYNPVILLLILYTKGMKTGKWKDIWTPMIIFYNNQEAT